MYPTIGTRRETTLDDQANPEQLGKDFTPVYAETFKNNADVNR
jgi:hypothetical protein